MKFLSVLGLTFVASVASASCPNLAGTYICRQGEDQTKWVLSQRVEGGATIYNDETDDYIADGQPHMISRDFLEGQYVATCQENSLSVQIDGRVFIDGELQYEIADDSEYSLQDTNNLTWINSYKRTDTAGEVYERNTTILCTRQND